MLPGHILRLCSEWVTAQMRRFAAAFSAKLLVRVLVQVPSHQNHDNPIFNCQYTLILALLIQCDPQVPSWRPLPALDHVAGACLSAPRPVMVCPPETAFTSAFSTHHKREISHSHSVIRWLSSLQFRDMYHWACRLDVSGFALQNTIAVRRYLGMEKKSKRHLRQQARSSQRVKALKTRCVRC